MRPPSGAPALIRMAPARDEQEPLTGQSPGPEWGTRLQPVTNVEMCLRRRSVPQQSKGVFNQGRQLSEHRGAL